MAGRSPIYHHDAPTETKWGKEKLDFFLFNHLPLIPPSAKKKNRKDSRIRQPFFSTLTPNNNRFGIQVNQAFPFRLYPKSVN